MAGNRQESNKNILNLLPGTGFKALKVFFYFLQRLHHSDDPGTLVERKVGPASGRAGFCKFWVLQVPTPDRGRP